MKIMTIATNMIINAIVMMMMMMMVMMMMLTNL